MVKLDVAVRDQGQAVSIRVSGLRRVIAVFDQLENPPWGRLLETIGRTLEEQTINHFTEEAGPGGKWKEPSRSYRYMPKEKGAPKRGQEGYTPAQKVSSRPLLILTGDLRKSIRMQKGPMEVAVGTDVWYGKLHQFGVEKTNLPARPFLGLTESDTSEMTNVIETYIDELTRSL